MQLPHSNSGEKYIKDNSCELPVGTDPSVAGTAAPGNSNGTECATMQEPDFSEFMWMANEDLEDFDRKVISELDEHLGIHPEATLGEEEEEFLQHMLEEEEERDTVYFYSQSNVRRPAGTMRDLSHQMNRLEVSDGIAAQSTLNPFAAEFIPGQGFQSPDNVAPAVTVMPQPTTHAMANQIYQSGSGSAISGSPNPVNNIHPNLSQDISAQNILWRQSNAQMNFRYSAPLPTQINGHDTLRTMYSNGPHMPMFMSNMTMFHMVNGAPFIRPPQNRFHHPNIDRGTEDEGYDDN